MSAVDTALHECLRTLRLSGMLHTLDARLARDCQVIGVSDLK